MGYVLRGIGKKHREFTLEAVLFIRQVDEVKDCQALFPLRKAQVAAHLLQKYRKRLRRTQEEDRIELWDADTRYTISCV